MINIYALCEKYQYRVLELEDAIKEHAAQRLDSRCQLDDKKLYELVGITTHPGLDVPKEKFLGNCGHFYDCQQSGEPYKAKMTWDEYKEYHAKLEVTPQHITTECPGVDVNRLLHASIGLCGESGEVLEITKKFLFGKRRPIDLEHVKDELSDVFFYLALALRTIDVELEDLMEYNVKKLSKRYPELLSVDPKVTEALDILFGDK
jgi:NTP pyrophosphatase (non-canonical NTP hydrolase)